MTMAEWQAKYGSHGLVMVVDAVEEAAENGHAPPERVIETLVKMTKELSEAMQMQARPLDDLSEALQEVWCAMPDHQDDRPVTLIAEGTDHWTASIHVGAARQTGGASTPRQALHYLAHQVRVYREERGF